MKQSRVCNLVAACQVELLQVGEVAQVRQSLVSDLPTPGQVEPLPSGYGPQLGEASVCDLLAVIHIELLQAVQCSHVLQASVRDPFATPQVQNIELYEFFYVRKPRKL